MTDAIGGPIKRAGASYDGIYDATFDMTDGDGARPVGPVAFPDTKCFSVQIQNDPDSAGTMMVGNEFSQSTPIIAGQAQEMAVTSLAIPYVRPQPGNGNITVNILALT